METTATNIRILCVEDNSIIAQAMQLMLGELGCTVDIAATGQQGIDKFSEDYDLVFMDIGLPDKSGIAVTREIRQKQTISKIYPPIVALTAYADEKTHAACLKAGMQEVFHKPLSVLQLTQVIQKCCSERN